MSFSINADIITNLFGCCTMRYVDRPPLNPKRITIESSQEIFFG